VSEEPRRKGRLRDVDSAAVAIRIKAFAWSLVVMVPAGFLGAYVGSGTRSPMLVTIGFAAGGFAVAFFGSLLAGEGAGRVAGSVYFSSGRSTSGRREYSLADSLIVRGRLDEAIAELQRAAVQYPQDAQPPLRLARLLRDRCARPEDALRWFRTAADRSAGDAGLEIATLREMIEVYTHVLRTPRRALPDLARLASRHPGSAAGAWARTELEAMKRMMRDAESE
jgi:hypothetical protein